MEHRYPDDPERIRGDASELLGLYALMRHFIELNFQGHDELTLERRSFDSCCSVVDLILACKTGLLDVTSESVCSRLQDAISTHLQCHIEAYGSDHVKPKHHLNHCLPEQFRRKRRVTDAFTIERLHLRVKPQAEFVKHTSTFELSVLGKVTQRQIGTLNEGWMKSGLRGKIVKNVEPGLHISSSLVFAAQTIAVGDLVCIMPDHAGEVAIVSLAILFSNVQKDAVSLRFNVQTHA